MKLVASLLVAALSVPVSAGVIRLDTPDSWPAGLTISGLDSHSAVLSIPCDGAGVDNSCVISVIGETGTSVVPGDNPGSNFSAVQTGLPGATDVGLVIAPTPTYPGSVEFNPGSINFGTISSPINTSVSTDWVIGKPVSYAVPETNSLLIILTGLFGLLVRHRRIL